MIAYGKQVGYPNQIGPKTFIEQHLNICFKILLAKKLVKPEHYNAYRQAAVIQYQLYYMANR